MAYLVNDQRIRRPQDTSFSVGDVKDWLCLAQLHSEIANLTGFFAEASLFGKKKGKPVTEADVLRKVRLTIPVPEWRWYDGPEDEVLNEAVVAVAMKFHNFVSENIDIRVKKRKRKRGKGFDYQISFKPHQALPEETENA